MKKELITVQPAAMLCLKAIQSLKAVAGGQVFMNPSVKKVLFIQQIIHLA